MSEEKGLNVFIEEATPFDEEKVVEIISLLQKELDFVIDALQIIFAERDFIVEINSEHLGHNYSTDIITFNYTGDNKTFDGEIYISPADAFENAERFGVSREEEILRLLVHGVLHLMGYDDIEENDRIEMKELEDSLVKKLDFVVT